MGSIINYAKAQLKAKFTKPITAIILFILPLILFSGTIPAAKFMFKNTRDKFKPGEDINNPDHVSFQHILMNVASLSFYIFYTITGAYDVVKERQILRKQHMLANGFSNLKFYLAWTLVYSVLIIPTSIVIIAVTYCLGLFPHVNVIVQFIDFYLLEISGVTVGFWIATYVPIAFIAGIVVAFFNLSFTGAYFGMARMNAASKETLYIFVSPMTFGSILNNFQHVEMKYGTQGNKSITLMNLIPFMGGEYSVFGFTFKLIFNNILYISFACLFDKLFKHLNRNKSELKKEAEFSKVSGNVESSTPRSGVSKISTYKVYKSYFNKKSGETAVLDNINFEVCEGETFAIVGEKGSGKSTLLKLLCGREVPSYGTVDVSSAIGLSQIGVMSTIASVAPEDDYTVFEKVSVADSINYYASILKNKINGFDLLKSLNFEKSFSTSYSKLDKVEKAKVKAAIAIMCNKDVLFFDEPTTDMTENDQNSFWKVLNSAKKGKTVIFTTTSLEEAAKYSDRSLVLEDGKVSSIGKVEVNGKSIVIKEEQLNVVVDC